MAVLDDLLRHEEQFTRQALDMIAEDRPLVEECVGLAFLALQGTQPIQHAAYTSISRLFTDACVGVEQTFMSTLRAQPRLGWAALRFAAECLKDMDCIFRRPALEQAWFAVLKASPDEYKAAHTRFVDERKLVVPNEVTRVCSLTMTLGNVFGAHPNASAFGLLGSPSAPEPGYLRLPLRATSPETIRWHIRHQLLHAYHITVTLADFRVAHLSGEAKQALAEKRRVFDQHMVPFVRANVRPPGASRDGSAGGSASGGAAC